MTALQHYYTSFVDSRTGSAGFQIKAMSPGISAEVQSLIPRLIAYRVPIDLDERAIATHPVALRYYYLNAQESVLLCSQSIGNDANGRPGNFFAHTLVLDPSLFTQMPPILFWHSPFWRTSSNDSGDTLAPLEDFESEAMLDMDEIWDFLKQGKRLALLHSLLSAVVHTTSQKRRIVIIDSDTNVALWIAAVSCLLPPPYRPLLSFATYHHDPHQVEFLITGTSGGSTYGRAEEDLAFFILNMQDNKVSEVSPSLYADTIIEYVRQQQYEEKVLRIFSDEVQRFPTPTCIDEQLDEIATYHWLLLQKKPVTLTPEIVAAVHKALNTFEHMPVQKVQDEAGERDEAELNHLLELVWHEETFDDQRAREIRRRIIVLQQTHKRPTYAPLRKDLEKNTRSLFNEHITTFLMQRVREDIKSLAQVYGNEAVEKCVNESEYLQKVLINMNKAAPGQISLFWQCIGPYLHPTNAQSLRLLMQTLQKWTAMRTDPKNKGEAKYLFDYIRSATQPSLSGWLQEIVRGFQQNLFNEDDKKPLKWFYYRLVQELSLQQREPYRTLLLPILPDIIQIEFDNDLLEHDQSGMFSRFDQWIEYAERSPIVSPEYIASRGLQKLKESLDGQRMQDTIAIVLQNPHLMKYVSVADENMLVQKFFAYTFISDYNNQYISLVQKYENYASLSVEKQTILKAILAMREGQVDERLVIPLQDYLAHLPQQSYKQEIEAFLTAFFKTDFSTHPDAHQHAMIALFNWTYEPVFHNVYWQQLAAVFTKADVPVKSIMAIFSSWFSFSSENTSPIQYFAPWLFLAASTFLQNMQQSPATATILKANAGRPVSAWYPLVREFLQPPRGSLFTMSQNLAKQLQKHIPLQKNERDIASEQTAQKRISQLFEQGVIQQRHTKNILTLVQKSDEDIFWQLYDTMLLEMLLRKDVDSLLTLLTFWFNAPAAYWQRPFPAQHFFMHLTRTWSRAKQEDEDAMQNLSLLLDKKWKNVDKSANGVALYQWYPIVHDLFY